MKRYQFLLLTALGFLSGILTNILSSRNYYFTESGLAAGPLFGIIVILYFMFVKRNVSVWRCILFIICSSIAYPIAFASTFYFMLLSAATLQGVIHISTSTQLTSPQWIFLITPAFFAGGSIGAAIVLAGLYPSVIRFTGKSFILLIVLGGILGAVSLFFKSTNFNSDPLLYIIWQTGMACGIGILATKEKT